MEEKYKKFLEYNWENSQQWKDYYRDLFPTPPQSKLLKYKKKFYKLKIDPDFDISYTPPISHEQSPSNNNTNNPEDTLFENYKIAQNLARPVKSNIILYFETIAMILFLLSVPLRIKTIFLAINVFIIRTMRLVGLPRFEISYIQALIMNDAFHSLVYSLQILTDRFNYYLIVPICISVIVGLCENISNSRLKKINRLKDEVQFINTNKEQLIQDRSYLELAIGFITIFGVFLKINSLLTPLIHWQLLRVRYGLNPYIKRSFLDLNKIINMFKDSKKCPFIIKIIIQKIQNFFEYMGKIDTTNSNDNNNNQSNERKCIIY